MSLSIHLTHHWPPILGWIDKESVRRLRRLLEVSNDLTRCLELPAPSSARRGVNLLDARWGALGVIGTDYRVEQFTHTYR